MIILGNLLRALATILSQVLRLYSFVILVSVLISWVSPDPFNPVVRILRAATEPIFAWVRRHLPFAMVGMLDLSPLIVLITIQLIQMVLVQSMFDYAYRMR